ncbi:hypothetical protein GOP47_0023928 [Adiantum capillus-veneris]|uniref:Pentatricopeptide repeat-containing protein n=1 Tax=Adiantum capillus-veneris TaxID=13818 RepID=A0A9D4U4M5_ADICA|nr:hypothetical protein GOP47_0023928 [Adiantum capillus-veneris]
MIEISAVRRKADFNFKRDILQNDGEQVMQQVRPRVQYYKTHRTLVPEEGASGRLDEGKKETVEIQRKGLVSGSIKPDKITFFCVPNACSYLALLKEGIAVHASIVSEQFESDIVCGTALINNYGKCGQVLYAVNVFDCMPIRALMTSYTQNGHNPAALSLFKSMLTEGIEPASVFLLGDVEACVGHYFVQ